MLQNPPATCLVCCMIQARHVPVFPLACEASRMAAASRQDFAQEAVENALPAIVTLVHLQVASTPSNKAAAPTEEWAQGAAKIILSNPIPTEQEMQAVQTQVNAATAFLFQVCICRHSCMRQQHVRVPRRSHARIRNDISCCACTVRSCSCTTLQDSFA